MEVLYQVNWWAIAASLITSAILGFFWYHPRIFGGVWANAFGLQDGDLDFRIQTRNTIAGLVWNLFSLYGLAVVLRLLGINNALFGLYAGLFLAFFLVLASLGSIAAFEQWRTPRLIIHGVYRLVILGSAGALYGWWH